ncbi:unnamed protein product [Heligmosomoides polygyrus]|uniref:Transposase n=1 Tax=Heligmosomoides polygyrus TaxID=6339 RepID=A0A183GUD7_HELPZ|nr:unnamed protein product [Heligmosomoides polygyrus]
MVPRNAVEARADGYDHVDESDCHVQDGFLVGKRTDHDGMPPERSGRNRLRWLLWTSFQRAQLTWETYRRMGRGTPLKMRTALCRETQLETAPDPVR